MIRRVEQSQYARTLSHDDLFFCSKWFHWSNFTHRAWGNLWYEFYAFQIRYIEKKKGGVSVNWHQEDKGLKSIESKNEKEPFLEITVLKTENKRRTILI